MDITGLCKIDNYIYCMLDINTVLYITTLLISSEADFLFSVFPEKKMYIWNCTKMGEAFLATPYRRQIKNGHFLSHGDNIKSKFVKFCT